MGTTLKTTFLALAVLALPGAAMAGSLENLERERAILLEAMLTPAVDGGERLDKLAIGKRRLVDLERILLRDKSVVGKNTPQVRKAFENYDLTFLAHASVEKNLSLTDHWLEQVGVSTHSLMSTRVGRR
jgi:hypothetical protein